MDNLKEVARALGFEVHQDTNMFYYGEWLSLDEDAAPLILVYSKGGIMEKMGWWWMPSDNEWDLGTLENTVKISPTRDPQVVIDEYYKTLPREPGLPELPTRETYKHTKPHLDDIREDILRISEFVMLLTAKVEKLEGK